MDQGTNETILVVFVFQVSDNTQPTIFAVDSGSSTFYD